MRFASLPMAFRSQATQWTTVRILSGFFGIGSSDSITRLLMSPSRFLPGPDFSPTAVLGVRAGPTPFPPSSANLRSFRVFSRDTFVLTPPDAA